jgi:ribosomal protein L40E
MTPLKKWVTVNLIYGVIVIFTAFAGLAITIAITQWEEASRIFGGIEAVRKYVTFMTFVSLITLVSGLLLLIQNANIAKADTIIGETFLRCPLCFGSNIIFDVKFFGSRGKVLCRDCHAQWEFLFDISQTRLSIIDYGIALRAEEKSLVPSTDNPEQWHKWAKERFRQRQQLSQTAHAPQGQAIFCRFCGHRNPLDAKFCSACGKELQA